MENKLELSLDEKLDKIIDNDFMTYKLIETLFENIDTVIEIDSEFNSKPFDILNAVRCNDCIALLKALSGFNLEELIEEAPLFKQVSVYVPEGEFYRCRSCNDDLFLIEKPSDNCPSCKRDDIEPMSLEGEIFTIEELADCGYEIIDCIENNIEKAEPKEKQRYSVNLTMIYNSTVEVEAASDEEAIELVKDNKEKFAPDSQFIKGEKTVDFAELLND